MFVLKVLAGVTLVHDGSVITPSPERVTTTLLGVDDNASKEAYNLRSEVNNAAEDELEHAVWPRYYAAV